MTCVHHDVGNTANGKIPLTKDHRAELQCFLCCKPEQKHQSSASLAFVQGIHRWPVNSRHKGPVTWKMFPFDDVIMCTKTMPVNQSHIAGVWKIYLRIYYDENILPCYEKESIHRYVWNMNMRVILFRQNDFCVTTIIQSYFLKRKLDMNYGSRLGRTLRVYMDYTIACR